MNLYDKLTAKYPAKHFSISTTQTVIEEDAPEATTRSITIEHTGTEVLKMNKTLFVAMRDAAQTSSSTVISPDVCDGAIATESMPFVGYVELKSKCSQNEVIKARSQIIASSSHMLTIAENCALSLADIVQKGIIVTQPITDETLTKARQRRQRDDNLNVTFSSARFLLKLIEGEAKDDATGISYVHVVASKVVLLSELQRYPSNE